MLSIEQRIKDISSLDNIRYFLNTDNKSDLQALFDAGLKQKQSISSNDVYVRGLVEITNICSKDCYYCGIRKSNKNFTRYSLDYESVTATFLNAYELGYRSLVIQGGERTDKKFIGEINQILEFIFNLDKDIRVTLSLGEQDEEVYQKWYDLGVRRYLLRVESSNPLLYKKLHPTDHSLENRIECLKTLSKIGYQVGTGVLIGVPGQTTDDLVDDIMFFKDMNIDMIGMGPYIPHKDTPLGHNALGSFKKEDALIQGLKMIALCRLILKDVNIVSTTALEALSSTGLEQGLQAGANVMMVNLNDYQHKKEYFLYEDKPCFESLDIFHKKLHSRIQNISTDLIFDKPGDSKHYLSK